MTLLRRAIDIVKRVQSSTARRNETFTRLPVVVLVTRGIPMADPITTLPSIAAHGAMRLPSVELDSYNVELKDDEGFIGDRASKGAFRDIIENWRKSLRKAGDDPIGDEPSEDITKKELDTLLAQGDREAAGIVHGAIEDFSQEFALVIRRYPQAQGLEGHRAHRGRRRLSRQPGRRTRDRPHRRHPQGRRNRHRSRSDPQRSRRGRPDRRGASRAGLDVQGSRSDPRRRHRRHQYPRRRRASSICKKAADLSKAAVWKFELWRHGDEEDVKREHAINNLVDMLKGLIGGRTQKGAQARALHRHRLPRADRGGRIDRSRRAEPARQLGEQQIQSAGRAARGDPQDRRRTRPPSSCTTTRWCRA